MLKYLIYLLLCIVLGSNANSFGQSVVRSSLSCLGSTYSNNGFILRQTTGQSSNTVVVYNGGLVLRQGFQQPLYRQNISYSGKQLSFTLSPNPAQDKTLLEIHGEISKFSIIISNINGMTMERIDDQFLLTNWLELKNLLPGIYIVTITGDNKIGSQKLIINH